MSWNEMSDDSWMENSDSDNDAQPKKEEATKPEQSQSKTNDGNKQQVSQQKQANKTETQKDKKEKVQKTASQMSSNRQKRVYPTDQELLEQYQSGKIEQNKRLKAINVFNKEQQQLLQNLEKDKKCKLKNYKQNCYVVKFWNKEDLIKFVKEKIQKGYKFKLGIYVETQNQKKWKAEKQKQREQQRAKHHDKPKEYKAKFEDEKTQEKKQEKKPGFRKEKDESQTNKQKDRKDYRKQKDTVEKKQSNRQQKQGSRYDHKKQSRNDKHDKEHKGERRQQTKTHHREQKKQKVANKSLTRENERSNVVTVLSDEASPSQVADWLKQNKLARQFKTITLMAPGNLLGYMEKVCQECYRSLQFGLSSEINESECLEDPTKIFRFDLKQKLKPIPFKKCLSAAYIDVVNSECFDTVQKYNTHVIGEQSKFDEKQYVEEFKKNYKKIVQKWEKFSFLAYHKNIAKLLRLSGIIKKLMNKNQFIYEAGISQKLPYVRFQICDLNKTKFKVDASAINSHLQG